jgi:hypothetical protein
VSGLEIINLFALDLEAWNQTLVSPSSWFATCISDKTDLPKTNWRNFLSDRVQKRNLVNFLSEKFLELAQSTFHEKNYSCDICSQNSHVYELTVKWKKFQLNKDRFSSSFFNQW